MGIIDGAGQGVGINVMGTGVIVGSGAAYAGGTEVAVGAGLGVGVATTTDEKGVGCGNVVGVAAETPGLAVAGAAVGLILAVGRGAATGPSEEFGLGILVIAEFSGAAAAGPPQPATAIPDSIRPKNITQGEFFCWCRRIDTCSQRAALKPSRPRERVGGFNN
ncbi:MAG: hypothetical protein BZY80_00140 [SAR202 cluster bacterium Io17-Chloro-G2]|nr:MAG: hypothetical protein BZY80_00140 [SAR202 cluster bacterium Io17-Chloro-G2]